MKPMQSSSTLMLFIIGLTMTASRLWARVGAQDTVDMCTGMLKDYRQWHHKEPVPYKKEDQLVYFLHIPRTAGRTFNSCMLKLGTTPGKRCPKAYDHLRLNMSLPSCSLLSSHDDYSVVAMLHSDVAVLSHFRDPIDRFLSAYEFAVEVGSRTLSRPANFRKRPDKIATEDVWPWSYLVPFFGADAKARVAEVQKQPQPDGGSWILVQHPDGDEFYYNKVLGFSKWNLTEEEKQKLLPPLNPYDNPLVMSLKEFAHHPIAKELLHNGQTFQVLGVTNYSHWADAGSMRDCFWGDTPSQAQLLDIATSRVQKFIHVGVTDKLQDSVTAAAVAMHFTMSGPAFSGTDEDKVPAVKQSQAADRGSLQAQQEADEQLLHAVDIPDLADRIRKVRWKLQSAQRELFRATQVPSSDAELVRLKGRVAGFRTELRGLQELLQQARSKLPTSTNPDTEGKTQAGAAGAAKKLPAPLGVEYQRCAQRAQNRNLQRRDNSLAKLAMPDGRTVQFSKAARKLIPPDIIDEIRQLNQADLTLHQLGSRILERNRDTWRAQGLLEDLPHVPPLKTPVRQPAKFHIPKPYDKPGDEL